MLTESFFREPEIVLLWHHYKKTTTFFGLYIVSSWQNNINTFFFSINICISIYKFFFFSEAYDEGNKLKSRSFLFRHKLCPERRQKMRGRRKKNETRNKIRTHVTLTQCTYISDAPCQGPKPLTSSDIWTGWDTDSERGYCDWLKECWISEVVGPPVALNTHAMYEAAVSFIIEFIMYSSA